MRAKSPTIRQLEYFIAVATSTNFRQAAERLKISQPTLTAQITSLEESLGTVLFERSRAGTLLSPAGREMLPLARNTLDQFQQLLHFAENRQKEPGGLFRLGVLGSLGPWLLPGVLPELRDMYPKLRLQILEGTAEELEQGLADGKFDLVMTVMPLNTVENQVRALFSEPWDLVVPADHPLAMKPMLVLEDLEHQDLLVSDDAQFNHQLISISEKSGANLLTERQGNSLNALVQMVIMGLGIAVLPSLFVRSEITGKSQNLVVLPLGNEVPGRTHVFAWRRHTAARQLFQKISYDVKVLGLDQFSHVLDEVSHDDSL